MALKPEFGEALKRFTAAAKGIIYDAKRFEPLLKMMDTRDGAIQAVKAVMGTIETKKPIPPQIAVQLAFNIYVLLVDMAEQSTGMKADKRIVMDVSKAIMESTIGSLRGQEPAQAPVAQPGLINQGV